MVVKMLPEAVAIPEAAAVGLLNVTLTKLPEVVAPIPPEATPAGLESVAVAIEEDTLA